MTGKKNSLFAIPLIISSSESIPANELEHHYNVCTGAEIVQTSEGIGLLVRHLIKNYDVMPYSIIRWSGAEWFVADQGTRSLPESSLPVLEANETPSSNAASYEVGNVSLISNDVAYRPFEHFLYGKDDYLFADGIPIQISLSEAFSALPEVRYADDFRVDVDGKDARGISYALYDDRFNIVFERMSDIALPDEPGVYLLCVSVDWSNNEIISEYLRYTGMTYIFKIVV